MCGLSLLPLHSYDSSKTDQDGGRYLHMDDVLSPLHRGSAERLHNSWPTQTTFCRHTCSLKVTGGGRMTGHSGCRQEESRRLTGPTCPCMPRCLRRNPAAGTPVATVVAWITRVPSARGEWMFLPPPALDLHPCAAVQARATLHPYAPHGIPAHASSPPPVITGTCAPAALVPSIALGSAHRGLLVEEHQATTLKASASLGMRIPPAAVDQY